MMNSLFFLGFPLSHREEKLFSLVPPHLLEVYLKQKNPDYLQEVVIEGVTYIGKIVPPPVEFQQILLIKMHLMSLLELLQLSQLKDQIDLTLYIIP